MGLPNRRLSVADYLAHERASAERHEYIDGDLFAMTGASVAHNRIVRNLLTHLHPQLTGGCEAFASDLRVHVRATDLFAYPDLIVACPPLDLDRDHGDTLRNPTVLVEVLSPSTEAYDRGRKFAHYRQIDSLQVYLLVAQDAPRIERYRRHGAHWRLHDFGPGAQIDLDEVGAAIRLDAVYDGALDAAAP
ncbi:MAG: Uma2 family endonuclease [Acidobacteriota bacterium]